MITLPHDEDHVMHRVLVEPDTARVVQVDDDLYGRLIHLCTSGEGSDLDLAVLVRHLLRRWSLRDKRDVHVEMAASISARLRRFRDAVDLREELPNRWSADPWKPAWLGPGMPDAAAAAGTDDGRRFRGRELAADPFFERWTGHRHYRTPGQRAACRAAVSAPPGSTVIAMLPTGSGKTEVALCLADRRNDGLTLIVVPTVALAYDFERRFQDHYARRNPSVDKSAFTFAWTAGTGPDARKLFQSRVREGRQPLLVTSPESMTRVLRDVLLDAASTGRLGGLVIDEAHLVTQWGRDFRPEFRTLADLRRNLLDRAEDRGYPKPITLLLSATLGSNEIEDLHSLFGNPGPCTLIAANALRAEPELWISSTDGEQARRARVIEALAHLPRPAVLYVTSPEKAELWSADLRHLGYLRLATVTGDTNTYDRQLALQGLRTSPDSPASIDLVVATSAFGLGIDYPHIRTVVHACLPETVDRWYQEVGRGGRDGDVSAGLLLTTPEDEPEARQLTVTVLTPETAHVRWTDMWGHLRRFGDKAFVDLEGSRGVGEGSYNRRWNAQVIQGLVELGACERVQAEVEERAALGVGGSGKSDWVAVELRGDDLRDGAFWDKRWGEWQKEEVARSKRSLMAAKAVARQTVNACEGIADYYRPSYRMHELFGRAADYAAPAAPCGRCPGCRRDGVRPPNDPPPDPPQAWPLTREATAELGYLAAAAGARDSLILLTTDSHATTAPPLARALVRRGVRHVAGVVGEAFPDPGWIFHDPAPVSPTELTPCSSFVIYPAGSRISGLWLVPAERAAPRRRVERAFDVLLVERGASINGRPVGHDLPALDARTALEILRS